MIILSNKEKAISIGLVILPSILMIPFSTLRTLNCIRDEFSKPICSLTSMNLFGGISSDLQGELKSARIDTIVNEENSSYEVILLTKTTTTPLRLDAGGTDVEKNARLINAYIADNNQKTLKIEKDLRLWFLSALPASVVFVLFFIIYFKFEEFSESLMTYRRK